MTEGRVTAVQVQTPEGPKVAFEVTKSKVFTPLTNGLPLVSDKTWKLVHPPNGEKKPRLVPLRITCAKSSAVRRPLNCALARFNPWSSPFAPDWACRSGQRRTRFATRSPPICLGPALI